MTDYAEALNELRDEIHAHNITAGWWDDKDFGSLKEGPITKYVIPTKLCLSHSELSEAMEGFRKNLMDDKLPHRSMLEVELADTLIRILDVAGALKLDIGGAVVEKRAYNAVRPDHKKEAREAAGGKTV